MTIKCPSIFKKHLSLHLKAEAKLVSRLVQFVAIEVAGQGHGEAISQLLLVAQTNLTVGVNLGSDRGILVKSIFASNGKVGSSSNSTGAGNSSLQLGVVLQINTSSKHLQVIGGAVKDHVTSIVVGGNVVLGQTRFAAVKGSLVSNSIWTVAKGGSDVHNWALGQVHVSIENKSLMLVFSLELASLVSRVGLECSIQGQLEAWHQLLVVHGGIQGVVRVPLLGEVHALLLGLVLGLQGSIDLASISGGVSSSSKLDTRG